MAIFCKKCTFRLVTTYLNEAQVMLALAEHSASHKEKFDPANVRAGYRWGLA